MNSSPEVVERLLQDNRLDATIQVEDLLDKTRPIQTSCGDLDSDYYRPRVKEGKFTALDAAVFHDRWDVVRVILDSNLIRPSKYVISFRKLVFALISFRSLRK